MSRVEEIESAIRGLTTEEMRQVHEWLENILEDQCEFTDEFRASMERSKCEMRAGLKPRVRQP